MLTVQTGTYCVECLHRLVLKIRISLGKDHGCPNARSVPLYDGPEVFRSIQQLGQHL